MCQVCSAFGLPSPLLHAEFAATVEAQSFVTRPAALFEPGGTSAEAPPPAEAGFFSPTGNPLFDGLLMGAKWISPVLTYSFPSAEDQFDGVADGVYTDHYGYNYTDAALVSPAQREAVRLMLEGTSVSSGPFWMGVADFTNLAFAEINGFGQGEGSGAGDIRVTQATLEPGVGGWVGDFPGSGGLDAGDVWISAHPFFWQDLTWDPRDPVPSNYAWFVMMHELGHALGLKHGHQASGGFAALPAALDSRDFSIMTYRAYVGQDPVASVADYWGWTQSWMMLDILALQKLYGANYAHNSGDTTYSWDPATGQMFIDGIGQVAPGANKVFLTIWDGAGIDTYDMSDYADGVAIDLRPGKWSITSEEQRADLNLDETHLPTQLAKGNVYNSMVFRGNQSSLIENAIGGDGNDRILGNGAANLLEGGAGGDSLAGGVGADTLLGQGGNDTLSGGAGPDNLAGGPGNDLYIVDEFDFASEEDGGGYDRVLSSGDWRLEDGLERLTLTGSLDSRGNGNSAANRLDGNGGNNRLVGEDGNDRLFGNAGDDTLVGGRGADRLDGGEGADVFYYVQITDRGDFIAGYDGAEDQIEIWAPGFKGGLMAGMDLAATGRFVENTTGLADSAYGTGQFIWNTDLDQLLWDRDGMGGVAALRLATLSGAVGMGAGEITLIG